MTIQAVRFELGDVSELPIMSDEEIQYFLDKNSSNIPRTCMDVAKTMLFKLSLQNDESVDIFSIKGSNSARQYMQALQMYIKNPDLNPLIQNAEPYAGGISKSDMQANNSNADTNYVQNPSDDRVGFPENFFEV